MPPPRLDNLPFDVFYQIATLLDDRDCIHLSRTNRIIYDSMQSELISRKTVEVSRAQPHSRHPRGIGGPKIYALAIY